MAHLWLKFNNKYLRHDHPRKRQDHERLPPVVIRPGPDQQAEEDGGEGVEDGLHHGQVRGHPLNLQLEVQALVEVWAGVDGAVQVHVTHKVDQELLEEK